MFCFVYKTPLDFEDISHGNTTLVKVERDYENILNSILDYQFLFDEIFPIFIYFIFPFFEMKKQF